MLSAHARQSLLLASITLLGCSPAESPGGTGGGAGLPASGGYSGTGGATNGGGQGNAGNGAMAGSSGHTSGGAGTGNVGGGGVGAAGGGNGNASGAGPSSGTGGAGSAGMPGSSGMAGGTSAGAAGMGSSNGGVGTAGVGGSTSGAGAGGGGAAPTTAVVADDFESGVVGMAPDMSKWQAFTEASGGSVQPSVTISSEDAHGGTKSVKVVAGSNSNEHAFLMNTSAFPLPSGVVFFRAFVKFQNVNWQNHVTFVESGTDQNTEVRLGGQAGYYHANLSSDGDGLSPNPFQSCTLCKAPVANQWLCVEGMFDTTADHVTEWVDGAEVVNARSAQDWHSGTGKVPDLTRLGFGWESYGAGVANVAFYDDVAIGYERLGCP